MDEVVSIHIDETVQESEEELVSEDEQSEQL